MVSAQCPLWANNGPNSGLSHPTERCFPGFLFCCAHTFFVTYPKIYIYIHIRTYLLFYIILRTHLYICISICWWKLYRLPILLYCNIFTSHSIPIKINWKTINPTINLPQSDLHKRVQKATPNAMFTIGFTTFTLWSH